MRWPDDKNPAATRNLCVCSLQARLFAGGDGFVCGPVVLVFVPPLCPLPLCFSTDSRSRKSNVGGKDAPAGRQMARDDSLQEAHFRLKIKLMEDPEFTGKLGGLR
jgi:hypothetical protein